MSAKETESLRQTARECADGRFGTDGWQSVTVTFVLPGGDTETVSAKNLRPKGEEVRPKK